MGIQAMLTCKVTEILPSTSSYNSRNAIIAKTKTLRTRHASIEITSKGEELYRVNFHKINWNPNKAANQFGLYNKPTKISQNNSNLVNKNTMRPYSKWILRIVISEEHETNLNLKRQEI